MYILITQKAKILRRLTGDPAIIPAGAGLGAADSKRNLIFVPQVAPVAVVGTGGDTTAIGAGICGSNNGCVGVYVHDVDRDRDHDRDDDDHGHDH